MQRIEQRKMISFLGATFFSFYKEQIVGKESEELLQTFNTDFLDIVKQTNENLESLLSSDSKFEDSMIMIDLIPNLALSIQTFKKVADIKVILKYVLLYFLNYHLYNRVVKQIKIVFFRSES